MKSLVRILIAGAAIAFAQAHAAAPGDAEAGKAKSQTCAACHGADGNAENPIYPIIAGQYRDYLAQALRDYRSGARNNAIMRGFALNCRLAVKGIQCASSSAGVSRSWSDKRVMGCVLRIASPHCAAGRLWPFGVGRCRRSNRQRPVGLRRARSLR